VTPRLNGYCADTAVTLAVGQVRPHVQRLLDVTRETLELALRHMKPGIKWSDIARLMQYHVEKAGFSVVREFVGHGVGHSIHEDPKVPNFVPSDQVRGDFKLRPAIQLSIYNEALLIFYGKASVYLKAMGKTLPEQWEDWIG